MLSHLIGTPLIEHFNKNYHLLPYWSLQSPGKGGGVLQTLIAARQKLFSGSGESRDTRNEYIE